MSVHKIVELRKPGSFSDDPLTDILRAGARQLLAQAIEAEVAGHIAAHADLTDGDGRRRIVRHGYLPERDVQTGVGPVAVTMPRVRDRDPAAPGGRIRFTSSILPPYLRPVADRSPPRRSGVQGAPCTLQPNSCMHRVVTSV